MVETLTADCPTLGALFFRTVERYRRDPALTWFDGEAERAWSTERFAGDVLAAASWMEAAGIRPGDRIAIYCDNRPEWHIVDFAAHLAGAVLVPIYPTLAPHQMRDLVHHSGARAIFFGKSQAEAWEAVRGELPEIEHAIAFDGGTGQARFAERLESAPAADREHFRKKAMAIDPDAVATIVYTSGTTGAPKGAMLSHRNLMFDVVSSLERMPERAAETALSVLPLSHVFERMLAYTYFYRGFGIAYGDPHGLKQLLARYRPSVIGVVPRVLEKMRDAIEAQIAAMPAHRRKIAAFLFQCGADDFDGKRTLRAKLQPLAEALVFRKIRHQLGGVEAFIVGGAWLNPELDRYFSTLGFHVVQGYGLTETAPVIACNHYETPRLGTVGPPIEGVEVRIDEEGEIVVRGPNVMLGYFRNPEATAAAIQDGWFKTGDLGRLEDGYLTITGRRKEILVLSNGKKVYYAPMEQAFRQSRLIEQAFVIGEMRNYASLIVVPNLVNLESWASERGIGYGSPEELLTKPETIALYRETVDTLQSGFSRFEQTKRFCFLPEEALLDLELVTPTQKVRRNVLDSKYAPFIDQLYQKEEPFVIPVLAAAAVQ